MRRTFRVRSAARQLAPLLVISLVTLGILLAVTPQDEWSIVGIVGLVLLAAIGIAGWLLTRTRLEVSDEGITYHAIGYRVAGRWEDVAGHARRVMGLHEVESLILRRPGIELSGWMAFAYKLLPAASIVSLLGGQVPSTSGDLDAYADAIPVGMFDADWRTGEIGTLVRGYAPQALATSVE